jgi:N-acetylglutamate synthase-like GNAT family acetyltransferase
MAAGRIRSAREGDLERLPAIERAAGRLFAEIGMTDVAEGSVLGVEDHREAMQSGWLWVAVDDADRPVGFALVHPHDGCAHLEEIAVHPDHGGRGLGRELLDAVVAAAREQGLPAVTLSTFREVPWNGPWYRGYGFRELADNELTPTLLAAREHESAEGLDVAARVFMRLDLG